MQMGSWTVHRNAPGGSAELGPLNSIELRKRARSRRQTAWCTSGTLTTGSECTTIERTARRVPSVRARVDRMVGGAPSLPNDALARVLHESAHSSWDHLRHDRDPKWVYTGSRA